VLGGVSTSSFDLTCRVRLGFYSHRAQKVKHLRAKKAVGSEEVRCLASQEHLQEEESALAEEEAASNDGEDANPVGCASERYLYSTLFLQLRTLDDTPEIKTEMDDNVGLSAFLELLFCLSLARCQTSSEHASDDVKSARGKRKTHEDPPLRTLSQAALVASRPSSPATPRSASNSPASARSVSPAALRSPTTAAPNKRQKVSSSLQKVSSSLSFAYRC